MSTVSMMIEAAERLSKDRSAVQKALQGSRQGPEKNVRDEQEEKEDDDQLPPS